MGLSYKATRLLQVFVQFFRVFVLSQLGQRFCFNLANTFAGNSKFLPDFFKRVAFAVIEPEAHFDNLLFAVALGTQHCLHLLF